jgi:hypothetical protein
VQAEFSPVCVFFLGGADLHQSGLDRASESADFRHFFRRFGGLIFLVVVPGTAERRWSGLRKFENTVNVADRVLLKI